MGNRKGHNEAQSVYEMLADMNEAKAQNIGRQPSGDCFEAHLRELLDGTLVDVVDFATKERVALEDLEMVQERTVIYLMACKETLTLPSSLGLARSLGYSDRALRHWRSKQADTPTAQWLEMFNDTCSDIISQIALKDNTFDRLKARLDEIQFNKIGSLLGKVGEKNE